MPSIPLTNSVDPDQTLHSAASDQGLHCLHTGFFIKNQNKKRKKNTRHPWKWTLPRYKDGIVHWAKKRGNIKYFLLSGNDETEGEKLIGNGSPRIVVERTVFTQKTFDEAFEPGTRPSPTIKQRAQRKITKYSCTGRCLKDFLFMLFPFIAILKNYKIRQDLTGDIIAGLTVGIMHIPQGKIQKHVTMT